METNRKFHRISSAYSTPTRQTGISVLLFLVVLMLFSIALIMVARIAPAYIEYYNVKSSIESLQSEKKSEIQTESNVRAILRRRFNVNDVKSVAPNNLRIEYGAKSFIVSVQYEVRKPLVGNLSIVAEFTTKSEISL